MVTGGIDRAQRARGGAGEERVEVGHQPPLSHRVQHAPGRAVQAQDNQSIDGLRHGIVPNLPWLARHRAPALNRAQRTAMVCIADTRSRVAGWTPRVDVDREVRRVVVGDLMPLALGAIDHRRSPAKLLAERQTGFGLARARCDTPPTSLSSRAAQSSGTGALIPTPITVCGKA